MWKQGEVVPVPKHKNPKTAKDYRPITLLWHLGKVSERCIAKKYRGCVRTELLKNQYAYCAKRNTTDALIHTFDDWTKQMDMEETCHIDVAFIDFSKAFDKLQPLILVEKLINNFGMNANLALLVKDFLTDRHQVVRYSDTRSEVLPVKVGTPQGSIMGPLLWLAYADDLQPVNVTTLKYADDTTLYCPKKKDEQNNFLSNSLQQASTWSTENCMLLNEAKTQVMKIALKADPCCPKSAPDLASNLTHTAKLLGVNIDTSLTFKEHVAISKKKCNTRLFAMRKLKQLSVCKDALLRFYQARVMPVITYAAPAWYGFLDVKTRDTIEGIQRLATKIMTPEVSSYSERCQILQLPRLTEYMDNISDKYFKKILNDEDHILNTKIPTTTSRRSTRRKNSHIKLEHCRTEKRKKSFIVAGAYRTVMS